MPDTSLAPHFQTYLTPTPPSRKNDARKGTNPGFTTFRTKLRALEGVDVKPLYIVEFLQNLPKI